jgi:hypothetical protein
MAKAVAFLFLYDCEFFYTLVHLPARVLKEFQNFQRLHSFCRVSPVYMPQLHMLIPEHLQ